MLRYRDFPWIAAVLIAGYFAWMTAPGLTTLVAPDDPNNLYRYWAPGPWQVLKASLLFVTSFYRPLGGLFYLPLFKLFGFHPLPYRIVIWALLWLNVWLLYTLARRVTGSRERAALATLIGCFHASALGVYFSTSMIYEVLSFTFMIGALVYYLRVRQAGRCLGGWEIAVLAVLFVCALDSKEMAVVLPAMLLAWELIDRGFSPSPWHRPRLREILPIAVTGVMAVAYTVGKMFGPGSLFELADYRPVYTLERFLTTTRAYIGMLLIADRPVSIAAALAFWATLALLALLMRRKALWFGLAFAFLAFLPVNFVPARQGFVLYIPLAGFAVYAAELVLALLDLATRRLRATPESRKQLGALAFVACLIGCVYAHLDRAQTIEQDMRQAQAPHWQVLQEFERVHPHAKPGGRLLLVDSPIEANWDIYFIAKLYFDDPDLRAAWMRTTTGDPLIYGDVHENFDNELRFEGTRLVQVR